MWDLVGNLEDRFSHNEAHLLRVYFAARCISNVFLNAYAQNYETVKFKRTTKNGFGLSTQLWSSNSRQRWNLRNKQNK